MPIYDQSYRHYEARAALRRTRFWPITREALRLLLARKAFLLFLLACWLPFVGHVIYLYAVTRFSGMVGPELRQLLAVDGAFFMRFYTWQRPLAVLVTVFAGAGLIAHDLRTNAILVYLARPLTRRDYVLGKFLTLALLGAGVTLVPALLLYGVGLALVPDQLLTLQQAYLVPAIVAVGALITVILSLSMLALSALSRNARVAGLSFIGVLLGLDLVRGLLWLTYRSPLAALVSIEGLTNTVGQALFGISARGAQAPWPAAVAVLVLLAAACLWVLRVRVRAVEVVA